MPDLTAASIHRESRWSTTVWAEESNFGAGIFPDAAPHAIPSGGLFDAYDVLCDRPGKIRKRGGTTTSGTTSTTAFATVFGRVARSFGGFMLYGGKPGGAVNAIFDSGDGSFMGSSRLASAGALGTNAGRPFEHLGFILFPSQTPGSVSGTIIGAGNAAGTITLGIPGSVGITAGDSKITTSGSDVSISGTQGMIVTISNATVTYIGRVERVIDAHTFTVFPRPTTTITTPTSAVLSSFITGIYGLTSAKAIAGAVGCSHQGRVLLGNIVYTKSGKEPELYAYRVYYSLLPDELPSGNSGSATMTGASYLNGDGFEDNNYFDVPSLEPIIALQPFGEGQVLILGPTKAHRLTGQLLTQTTTRSGITYDVHPIPNSVGCLSEQSVQATPIGVVWASADGVYVSDGSRVENLMSGKTAETWRDAVSASGAALVVGSALVRNHYIVFTGGYHYCCNLATRAWTRLFGAGIRCFYSASDPTDPSKVYGLRYWSGSPPTFANGCLMRLDAIFSPASTNKADVDGTTVNGIIITRSLAAGDPVGVKNFARDQLQYATPQANATVDRTVANPADAAWTSLGTLPLTSGRADYTFGMGLTSVQRGVSAAYRVQTGSCDSFELYAIKTAFQPDQSGVSV